MFTKQFVNDGLAHTLNPEEVLENHVFELGTYTLTHSDGWTITGTIVEDYCYWINEFEAIHPTFGKVWGNFEEIVYADTQKGYEAFCASHPVNVWDYGDI